MNTINLTTLKNVDTRIVARAMMHELRNGGDERQLKIKSIVSAFIIERIQSTYRCENLNDFLNNAQLDREIEKIIVKYGHDCWDCVQNNLSKFTSYELLAYILFDNSFEFSRSIGASTPRGILDLAISILDIKDTDEVLELCSGKGNFIVEATTNNVKANFTGVDLNITQNDVATLRTSIIRDNYKYILSDAMEYNSPSKVDKIFANYPFMVRSLMMSGNKELLAYKYNLTKDIISKCSSDWMFNLSIINQLADDGKAVVLMTNGSTWNMSENRIRQYFIEQGYIEAVISLPSNLLADSTIPVSMVVLSKNNKYVKLVDATNEFVADRRMNILAEENIESIVNMLNHNSEKTITKTIEELSENEFVLNPTRYLEVLPCINGGVEFGSVIKGITRGCQIRASELEEYKSNVPTNYQYLMLSNINDGIITLDNDGQYLKEVSSNLERYCIKNNSIVLSKHGMPAFKSAVAQVEEGTKVVANGSLFVIELDEEKVNPYYIQAFFASELGSSILKSIYTGATLPTITLDNLKRMIIPLPSLDKQNEIGNRYAACIDEMLILNMKLEKTKDRMKNAFNEEDKNC